MKFVFSILRMTVLGVTVGLLVMAAVSPAKVQGESMEPSLETNDWVLLNKAAYLYNKPTYGDIVAFETDVYFSTENSNMLVKRIVGLPGDTVELRNGLLYRNGKAVYEPYVANVNPEELFGPVTVVKDKVFVLGDNRAYSRDSRDEAIGQIEISEVLGRVKIL